MRPPAGGQPYRVSCLGPAEDALRQLRDAARLAGTEPDFLAVLRTITDRLTHDPNNLGEPRYHLRFLDMVVRVAIVGRLLVDFAVNEERRIVVVRDVRLLSG